MNLFYKPIMMVLLCAFLSSCMILPYPGHRVHEGREIEITSLQWMLRGSTTRAEVIDRLGEPDIDLVDRNTIAYTWSGQSGGVLLIFYYYVNTEPILMRRALMIRFNEDGFVADYGMINRPTEKIPYDVRPISFDAGYDDWRYLFERWQKSSVGEDSSSGVSVK